MSEFKNIPLKSIEATTQTRQFFDEAALNELADSIRKQGVLQPILVRKKGKMYEIIAGERRYRAAKIAELTEIPCHIVQMDDNQALEAQITENLQRKDVHPMEEAHAFKRLIDDTKMDIEEIAVKVGKGVRYVAGRLKLIDLNEDFQKAFYADKMPVSGAILIAAMNQQFQADYYQEDWNRWQDEDFYKTLADIEREIDYMANELKDAKFDITDDKLVPSAGACTDCQKNTACYKLLFQEEGKGRCTDRECFKLKEDLHKKALLKDIVDNHPDYIFLPNRYYTDKDRLNAIKSLGVDIADPEKWEELRIPNPPDPSYWDLEDDDEKESYQEELKDYEIEKKEYEEAVASGLMRKAYAIDKGVVIDVIPTKKAILNAEPGSLDDTDPEKAKQIRLNAELKALMEKRQRNEQLVLEKTYAKLQEIDALGPDYRIRGNGLNHVEDSALMMILFGNADYEFQRDMAELYKFERHRNEQVFKWLIDDATNDDKLEIMRSVINKRLQGQADISSRPGEITAYLQIADEFLGKQYNEFLLEQQEAYAKRNAAIDKQIESIKEQLSKEHE